MCRPYFQVKHTVSPYLEPYYDTYAAPYVQLVRPYYDAVDRAVLTPAWGYASAFGGARFVQAQGLAQAQWEKSVQPQLVRGQAAAKAKYDQTIAPYVDSASTAVSPYFEIARTNILQTYHELLLPTYQFVEPYALQGFAVTSAFTTGTAIPSAVWVWNKTYVFLDGTVWPQLRIVYAENVEPQLVKIGQRLGRYNANGAQKPTVETLSR